MTSPTITSADDRQQMVATSGQLEGSHRAFARMIPHAARAQPEPSTVGFAQVISHRKEATAQKVGMTCPARCIDDGP